MLRLGKQGPNSYILEPSLFPFDQLLYISELVKPINIKVTW